MFCPRCRDEYREGFTWCHDCDVALMEALPDEPDTIAVEDGDTEEEAEDSDAAPAHPAAEPLRVLELGLVLFIGFGYSLVSSFYHWWHRVRVGATIPGSDSVLSALDRIAASVPPICVLIYVLSRQGRSLRHLGVTRRWSDLPLGLALAALTFLPWGAPWHISNFSTQALVPLSLAAILCAAAKEELLVRAYMMSEVLELTGSAFLAVASSTCFQALYHLYLGRWPALSAAKTFLIYSLFYWKTRRATPVVLAHFTHNLWLDLSRGGY